jgi:hypothetical protein
VTLPLESMTDAELQAIIDKMTPAERAELDELLIPRGREVLEPERGDYVDRMLADMDARDKAEGAKRRPRRSTEALP